MEIIPVIDLKSGQVVHARAGERHSYRPVQTPLSDSSAPEAVLAGVLGVFPFRRLYIADLDAILGEGTHDAVLPALASRYPQLEFWVDNGVADHAGATAWLGLGLGKLVIGSESQTGTELVAALRRDPRTVLSLDFRADTFLGPPELLNTPALWPERLIVMSLARVGAGQGPDFDRLASIVRRASGRRVYAAGGVRNAADLRTLRETGCAGALVASALHGGQITKTDIAESARR
jgi:phosphoribosylformimino-5-aminoimidazole carboxamide ribotide isomerase